MTVIATLCTVRSLDICTILPISVLFSSHHVISFTLNGSVYGKLRKRSIKFKLRGTYLLLAGSSFLLHFHNSMFSVMTLASERLSSDEVMHASPG